MMARQNWNSLKPFKSFNPFFGNFKKPGSLQVRQRLFLKPIFLFLSFSTKVTRPCFQSFGVRLGPHQSQP
jgi:hypothetical protein